MQKGCKLLSRSSNCTFCSFYVVVWQTLADRQAIRVHREVFTGLFESLAVCESVISHFYIKIPLDLKLCITRDK